MTPAKRGKSKKVKTPQQQHDQTPAERRASMTWAQRLKRVFNIDIETCSECGGDVRIIASIEDPVVINKEIYPDRCQNIASVFRLGDSRLQSL